MKRLYSTKPKVLMKICSRISSLLLHQWEFTCHGVDTNKLLRHCCLHKYYINAVKVHSSAIVLIVV